MVLESHGKGAATVKQTRVLLLTDEATIGGGQRHILALARGLSPRNYTVAVACPAQGYLTDELHRFSLEHIALSLPERPNPVALYRTWRVMKEYAPDVLHTHGGTAGFYGRLAASLMPSVRVVHTYHGIHYLHQRRSLRTALYTSIDRYLLRRTHAIICVARADLDDGRKAGVVEPRIASVITNGIDPKEFRTRRRARKNGSVIGTIGRLHVQKGQAVLLEAMRMILKEHPEASLRIVGDGDLMAPLKKKAAELGVATKVSFAGARTDTAEQLAGMDVFVLPSLWEGFPIVLLEAMAAEKPIVASRIGGVTEIVEDGVDALLVEREDAPALASAVLRILQVDSLRKALGRRAGEKVRTRFTAERMVRETEEVYRRIVA